MSAVCSKMIQSSHFVSVPQEQHPLLQEARLINGNMRRNIKSSNFTTALTGRFYKNGSLESHKARCLKVKEMRIKRGKLRSKLNNCNNMLDQLKAILQAREKLREKVIGELNYLESSTIRLQSHVRKKHAQKRVILERNFKNASELVATFGQVRYRGSKGRKRAKDYLKKKEREKSAVISMQSKWRCIISTRVMYMKKRNKERKESATRIQAMTRKNMAIQKVAKKKKDLFKTLQEIAAIKIQSSIRLNQSKHHVNEVRNYRKDWAVIRIQSRVRGCIGRRIASNLKRLALARGKGKATATKRRRRKDLSQKNTISQIVDNGPRRSFVVGVPRETSAAMIINAAKNGRQPVISITTTPRSINNGGVSSRRKSCDQIVKKIPPKPVCVYSTDEVEKENENGESSLPNENFHPQTTIKSSLNNERSDSVILDHVNSSGDGKPVSTVFLSKDESARQKAAARVVKAEKQINTAKAKAIEDAQITAARITELDIKRKKFLINSLKTTTQQNKTENLRIADPSTCMIDPNENSQNLGKDRHITANVCSSNLENNKPSIDVDNRSISNDATLALAINQPAPEEMLTHSLPSSQNLVIPKFDTDSFEDDFVEGENDLEFQ